MSDVSESLRSLTKNEQPWAIRSHRSEEFAGNSLIRSSLICSFRSFVLSDCEQFAQIAQDKWATVSESLRSLKTNERPWAIRSGRAEKWANERFAQKNLAKKSKILFYYVLFKV